MALPDISTLLLIYRSLFRSSYIFLRYRLPRISSPPYATHLLIHHSLNHSPTQSLNHPPTRIYTYPPSLLQATKRRRGRCCRPTLPGASLNTAPRRLREKTRFKTVRWTEKVVIWLIRTLSYIPPPWISIPYLPLPYPTLPYRPLFQVLYNLTLPTLPTLTPTPTLPSQCFG